ncbi:hypothetical protein KQI84_17775 [bacterium]|nr:hypothetical protein [bacterium]
MHQRSVSRICAFVAMVLLVGSSAFAQQLTDNFDNPTYDGSFDNTVWQVNTDAVAGAAVQNSTTQVLTLTTSYAGWNQTTLFANNKIDITNSADNLGTPISFTINEWNVDVNRTTGWGDNVDVNLKVQLDDTATTVGPGAHDMYSYAGAMFGVFFVYDVDVPDKLKVEVWEKNAGETTSGTGKTNAVIELFGLSYPLDVDLVVNDFTYQLALDGQLVLEGPTNINISELSETPSFMLNFGQQDWGHGSVQISAVSVGDVDTGTLNRPTTVEDDFANATYDGGIDETKWETLGADPGQGTIAQGSGALAVTPGNFAWAPTSVDAREAMAFDGGSIYISTDVNDISAITGPMRVEIGAYSALWVWDSYDGGQADVVAHLAVQDGNTTGTLQVFAKSPNNYGDNGPQLANSVITLPSTPFGFEIQVGESTFDVYINDSLEASGTHAADFSEYGQAHGHFAIQNIDWGRGTIVLDNLRVSKQTQFTNVNDWYLLEH